MEDGGCVLYLFWLGIIDEGSKKKGGMLNRNWATKSTPCRPRHTKDILLQWKWIWKKSKNFALQA